MDLLIGLFIVIVGGCWLLFRAIGRAAFPDKKENGGFVDNSVHHHHYHVDNRTVNIDGKEYKNLKK